MLLCIVVLQHEGDTTFKLRAPFPTPRHRREEGKWSRGTSRCVGALVAPRLTAFRLGRTELSLAGPRSPWREPPVRSPNPSSFFFFFWLQLGSKLESHQRLVVLGHLVSTFLWGVIRHPPISQVFSPGVE